MSELALRTRELLVQKAKYLAWKPVGAVIVAQSAHTICRKWLEICCDLVSPQKRDNYRALPGWQRLCDAWTPELRLAWLEADRPNKDWPLSQLLQDHTFSAKLWDELILPIGVDKDLPLAPESDVPVHQTWLWSEAERKTYCIVVNQDADSPTVDEWNGCHEWDLNLDATYEWEYYAGVNGEQLRRSVHPDHKLMIRSRKLVNYKTELALSSTTLAKIADPTVTVHPDFTAPVAAVMVKQPDAKLATAKEGKP